jgi:hypothetical protein
MKNPTVKSPIAWLAAGLCLSFTGFAAQESPSKAPTPDQPGSSKPNRAEKGQTRRSEAAPTLSDVSYGPDESNKIDFWKANSAVPAPLVV